MSAITEGNWNHGSKASISTTRVQLTSRDLPCRRGITIKAADGNSGTVYVGRSTVTAGEASADTDGYPLIASQEVFIEGRNANEVYCIASGAGQAVHFICA